MELGKRISRVRKVLGFDLNSIWIKGKQFATFWIGFCDDVEICAIWAKSKSFEYPSTFGHFKFVQFLWFQPLINSLSAYSQAQADSDQLCDKYWGAIQFQKVRVQETYCIDQVKKCDPNYDNCIFTTPAFLPWERRGGCLIFTTQSSVAYWPKIRCHFAWPISKPSNDLVELCFIFCVD